ncbi:DUF1552 domain-containing protein [Urbifossiella limnaea]|uniref:DUF1552 domain-containing protein n=1 Tax=Urbifossiella limnaea TaxID=2528023 RepID=A0A517Y2Z8_9BACT|nr:DUF1552 domain-containing protein [Urbifossiella limnaea]QDU24137.1 hypothetical protein ETAA1_61510 [Urbifossiella limnaea]
MPRPSWLLDRRAVLRGAGLALALPWLEAMAHAAPAAKPPRRFCAFFFGNGVNLQTRHPGHEDWHWFPHADGPDYTFTKSLEPLAPHRADLTILGGLSHPTSRQLVGHNTVDVWLTGADIRETLTNSASIDQVIARHQGAQTRIPSLVLSSHGGVGTKSRSTTIAFDQQGRAVPAESNPRRVFERLFEPPTDGDLAARRRALTAGRRRVDFLLDDARSLRNSLGRPDQQRLDEFLQSLDEVEGRVARAQDWLGQALPKVDRGAINLDVSPQGPTDYIRTMYDLIALAFETDTTRSAAYQVTAEDGVGVCDRFPTILNFGRRNGHHGLSHDADDTTHGWGRYDRYLAEQFGYFLARLARVREGDGRLLDNTVALYGSGTSTTHNARNYPLVLAGGKTLGLKHGRYIKQRAERPLGDLFLTLLHRFDVPARSFADNAGEFREILAS